jgi:hypothetical protein
VPLFLLLSGSTAGDPTTRLKSSLCLSSTLTLPIESESSRPLSLTTEFPPTARPSGAADISVHTSATRRP